MTPYYEDSACVIYHGDCEDVIDALQPVDLLLTDPPYGIAHLWKGGKGHGWGKARSEGGVRNQWDDVAPDPDTLLGLIEFAKDAVVWGGNYFALPPSRGWFVWNKPERGFTLAEAELAWTTRDAVIRVRDLPRSEPGRLHPTQKPVSLMRWCLSFFPDAQTVLDPYMGSGTSLVAAKSMGCKSIGIDLK